MKPYYKNFNQEYGNQLIMNDFSKYLLVPAGLKGQPEEST